jgi:hypothetical protein
MAKENRAKKTAKASKARKTTSVKSAKSAQNKLATPTTMKMKAAAWTSKTLKRWSAELSASVGPGVGSAGVMDAVKAVPFAKDNANVFVSITTAGQSGMVPCTLNLPVGIFPLHYNATGVGAFTVTVTGAELSHPIDGTAPDAGTVLVKVS